MVLRDGQPVCVSYDFPLDENWERIPDYPEFFQYMEQVRLTFSISEGLITAISIYSGPYAE